MKDARKAAHAILALASAQNGDHKKSLDLSARAWTLLATHYEEVRAAGLFLFRSDDGDARFPSVVTAGRAAAKRAPAPAPTAPPP